jgi:hypothetical protein
MEVDGEVGAVSDIAQSILASVFNAIVRQDD